MKQRRVLPVILGSVGLLMLLWLLFACVAPPGAEVPASRGIGAREVGEVTCKTFTSLDVPKAIPDHDLEVPLGSYTTSKLLAPIPGYITDLTVTFTLNHTCAADLKVVLCGPRNLHCGLVERNLTCDAGVWTIAFSSDPTQEYLGSPPYSGSYPVDEYWEPLGLGKFRNAAAAGEWRLGFLDMGALDVGSLTAWELELCTTPLKDTPTPTPTALPPLPTWTPMYGCAKNGFLAAIIPGQTMHSCECNYPGFTLLPDTDSGLAVGDGSYSVQSLMCFGNCLGGYADVQGETYAQNYSSYFTLPGYASARFETTGYETPPAVNTSGGDGPLGCYSRWERAVIDARFPALNYQGFDVVDRALSTCGDAATGQWNYSITWGACLAPTRVPTSAPPATATRPCPTALPAQADWWSW